MPNPFEQNVIGYLNWPETFGHSIMTFALCNPLLHVLTLKNAKVYNLFSDHCVYLGFPNISTHIWLDGQIYRDLYKTLGNYDTHSNI